MHARSVIFGTVVAALSSAVLSGCAVHITEKSFLRPVAAPEISADTRVPAGYTLTTERVPTSEGDSLYVARFARADARMSVLFFGGNLSTVAHHAAKTVEDISAAFPANYVFADYRGYGQSSGRASISALSADAETLFQREAARARARGERLMIAGYSLGSVVAAHLAQRYAPDALILVTTITNVDDMLASAPWYAKLMMRAQVDEAVKQIDNLSAIKAYRGPLLVVAAQNDTQTAPALSQKVFDASSTPASQKMFSLAKNAGHNDVLIAPETQSALGAFAKLIGM